MEGLASGVAAMGVAGRGGGAVRGELSPRKDGKSGILRAMPRDAPTATTARLVGLAPSTLQKYAQEGRIPFNRTPGGHRRFDPLEVAERLGRTDQREVAASLVARWIDEIPTPLRPFHVSLYGSVARGDAGPSSDIDLLVVRAIGVGRSDPIWAALRVDLILAVERGAGRSLDLAELGLEELSDFAVSSPRLAESVCEEGIPLHGPALGEIYDELARA